MRIRNDFDRFFSRTPTTRNRRLRWGFRHSRFCTDWDDRGCCVVPARGKQKTWVIPGFGLWIRLSELVFVWLVNQLPIHHWHVVFQANLAKRVNQLVGNRAPNRIVVAIEVVFRDVESGQIRSAQARANPIGSRGTATDSSKKKNAFATASLLPSLALAGFGNPLFASLQLLWFRSPCAHYDACSNLWLAAIIGFSVRVSDPRRRMRRSGTAHARASREEGFVGQPLGNKKRQPFRVAFSKSLNHCSWRSHACPWISRHSPDCHICKAITILSCIHVVLRRNRIELSCSVWIGQSISFIEFLR